MSKTIKVFFLIDSFWGKQNEVRIIKKSFANWLLSKNLIKIATLKDVYQLEKKNKEKEETEIEEKKEALRIKKKLENDQLSFSLKKDNHGITYGSIDFKKIIEELKKRIYNF